MSAQTPFPERVAIGEKYGPAMEITEQADADAYFARCVEHSMRALGLTPEQAESLERQNLGYYSGYYGHETMQRVARLFRAEHPVGVIAAAARAASARRDD
jgi:hypothetical protein